VHKRWKQCEEGAKEMRKKYRKGAVKVQKKCRKNIEK